MRVICTRVGICTEWMFNLGVGLAGSDAGGIIRPAGAPWPSNTILSTVTVTGNVCIGLEQCFWVVSHLTGPEGQLEAPRASRRGLGLQRPCHSIRGQAGFFCLASDGNTPSE